MRSRYHLGRCTVTPGGFVRVADGGEIKRRLDTVYLCGYVYTLGGPEQPTLFM
jgi:hypothetical protein